MQPAGVWSVVPRRSALLVDAVDDGDGGVDGPSLQRNDHISVGTL